MFNVKYLEIRVRGHSRSLKMVPFESFGLSCTHWGNCIISEIKQDSDDDRRIAIFHHTPAYNAPLRRSPLKYCHDVWYRKTRMVCLAESKKKFDDRLRLVGLDTISVCGGQMNIARQHSPRYAQDCAVKNGRSYNVQT